MATQHGAVWLSANGEPEIASSVPSAPTSYTDTEPAFAPSCALDTKSWLPWIGENVLPNGPIRCAPNGEPGAGVSRPSLPMLNPSRYEGPALGPTRVATSSRPSGLIRTWPGSALSGRSKVDPATCLRCPPASSRNPV